MSVMKGHAVANGVYVAAINRTRTILAWYSRNPVLGIFVCAGPQARFWHKPHTTKKKSFAEVDLDLQENVRPNWPFFRDRRIDAFGDITKSNRLMNTTTNRRFPAEWKPTRDTLFSS
jgi:N-carbamoylputrescine amidase